MPSAGSSFLGRRGGSSATVAGSGTGSGGCDRDGLGGGDGLLLGRRCGLGLARAASWDGRFRPRPRRSASPLRRLPRPALRHRRRATCGCGGRGGAFPRGRCFGGDHADRRLDTGVFGDRILRQHRGGDAFGAVFADRGNDGRSFGLRASPFTGSPLATVAAATTAAAATAAAFALVTGTAAPLASIGPASASSPPSASSPSAAAATAPSPAWTG